MDRGMRLCFNEIYSNREPAEWRRRNVRRDTWRILDLDCSEMGVLAPGIWLGFSRPTIRPSCRRQRYCDPGPRRLPGSSALRVSHQGHQDGCENLWVQWVHHQSTVGSHHRLRSARVSSFNDLLLSRVNFPLLLLSHFHSLGEIR